MKCAIIYCNDEARIFPRSNKTGKVKENYGYCILHWQVRYWKGYHGVYADGGD